MTDIANDTTTTAAVAVGGSATGEIETADDKDWFRGRARGGAHLPLRPRGRAERARHALGHVPAAHSGRGGEQEHRRRAAPDLQRRLPGLARQPGDVHGEGVGDVLRGGIGRPRRDGHLHAHGDRCHARARAGGGGGAGAGGGGGCRAGGGGGGAGEANQPAAVWRGRPAVRRQLVGEGIPRRAGFPPTARTNRS